MTFLWAVLFVLAVFVFWCTNFLGLPGNWMIVAATALYVWLLPEDNSGTLRWVAVAIVASLALLGELVELGASAASVKRVGGSRRGSILAALRFAGWCNDRPVHRPANPDHRFCDRAQLYLPASERCSGPCLASR